MKSRKVDNICQLIGGTPMVRINRMNPNPGVEVYAKLDFMNPGGSVKDRIGIYMIEAAEKEGRLQPGKAVLEASSGNTAIGLAMACAVKGYQLVVTMAESASEERKKILRAYGAELILTPGHLSTDGAIEEAYRLAREHPERYALVDQFNNEANWRAHYEGTGREILEATDGKVDVVVLTMGTTGTLMGTTRILGELSPSTRVVGVEPYKGHKIQGLKNMQESYPPGIFDPEVPDEIVNVEDEEAFETARRLAREEGILVGMSSGAAMAAAIRVAAKMEKGTVVTLLPDSGERYLSTSLFASQSMHVPIRLYNTLSRSVEDLVPVREGRVGIYSCGPSLDGPPDLGLCRRMVHWDLVRRYLEHRGFEVDHVVSLADIDDRAVNEALEAGADLGEFTRHWEEAYHAAARELKILPPTNAPRASEHVTDMLEMTRKLIAQGTAYEKLRSVYFSIGKFPEYGRLSHVDPEAVATGKSTEYDYYDKENPRDFSLFKRSNLAELKAGIYWKTPWGNARPGWHIECATMATQYLGQPFDIHTASTNLMFPHGDNEIAIAQSLTGKKYTNVWLHSEMVVTEDGRAVGRRHDNVVTLDDLTSRGHGGAVVRFWLLETHYRRTIQCSEGELARAAASVGRLNNFVTRLKTLVPGQENPELEQLLYEARTSYREMMDNDLNMPRALAHLFAFVRRTNRLAGGAGLSAAQVEKVLAFVKEVDMVLAVIDWSTTDDDDDIDELVTRRTEARKAGQYDAADAIRTRLDEMGIELFDTPSGTAWRRR